MEEILELFIVIKNYLCHILALTTALVEEELSKFNLWLISHFLALIITQVRKV